MRNTGEDDYGHVLKYTGFFGGVQGLNILISLVRNKIVAVLLGPSGMGLVTLFNTTVNFISQSTNFGISFSAIRHLSELFDGGDEKQVAHFIKVVRGWSLLTALLGVLACMVAGPVLNSFAFTWGDHTLHFMLLAPAIALMAITGGETAILKATRRLKALASVQVLSVLGALALSLPIYYFFGEAGVVPVIVGMAIITMLLTIRYSYRFYPLHLRGTKGILGEGMSMVRLGVGYTLAGIVGSGAEMLIRSYLNVRGDLEVLGLYNSGYMIAVTYASLVFSALETDYFPRLSGVNRDVEATNAMVNRQSEVIMLLIAPMLAVLIVALPVLIPLLFSGKFTAIVSMTQVAVLGMYLKALTMPVAYITLARGYSRSFLLLETLYFVALLVSVVVCYESWGLLGTGIAIVVAHAVECVLVQSYARVKYQYRASKSIGRYALVQISLGIAVYASTLLTSGWTYWVVGGVLAMASTLYSALRVRRISKKS